MRAFGLLLMLAVGAAPPTVPMGRFQDLPRNQDALDFASGGLVVHIATAPCPARPTSDSACAWDGRNNVSTVTVRRAGAALLTVTTDPQAMYMRVAVVRLGVHDPYPGVVIENQSGGSGGAVTLQVLVPLVGGWRVDTLGWDRRLEGELADTPRDLTGDGNLDLILGDGAFDSVFGCNACTPRPSRVLAVIDGRLVDESAERALRPMFAKEMADFAPACRSAEPGRNGACAAYVAAAARAGRFAEGWASMMRHYERSGPLWQGCTRPAASVRGACPDRYATHYPDFPTSLHAFLVHTGYLPADS